jgi:hypothetical protein
VTDGNSSRNAVTPRGRDAAREYGIATAEPHPPQETRFEPLEEASVGADPAGQTAEIVVLGLLKSLGYSVLDVDGVGRASSPVSAAPEVARSATDRKAWSGLVLETTDIGSVSRRTGRSLTAQDLSVARRVRERIELQRHGGWESEF